MPLHWLFHKKEAASVLIYHRIKGSTDNAWTITPCRHYHSIKHYGIACVSANCHLIHDHTHLAGKQPYTARLSNCHTHTLRIDYFCPYGTDTTSRTTWDRLSKCGSKSRLNAWRTICTNLDGTDWRRWKVVDSSTNRAGLLWSSDKI